MIVSAAFDGGLAACRLAQREIMMAIASKRHSVRRNISDLAKSHSPCVFAQPVRTSAECLPTEPKFHCGLDSSSDGESRFRSKNYRQARGGIPPRRAKYAIARAKCREIPRPRVCKTHRCRPGQRCGTDVAP